MFVKQIGVATLAATILTGSAAVANAESNVSGVDGGLTSESTLQRDWQSYESVPYASPIPFISPDTYAYGYAGESRHLRSHARAQARIKHRN
jgi:hypothetical protein